MGCFSSKTNRNPKLSKNSLLLPDTTLTNNQNISPDTDHSAVSSKKINSNEPNYIANTSQIPKNNNNNKRLLIASDNNSTTTPTSPTTGIIKFSPNDITKDPRNLSICRLKRLAQITDSYQLSKEVLGTGISGAVFIAYHIQTNKRYAIKTLSLKGVSVKKAATLHNEVSIYLQLDHPNIAKLIEVYETDEAIHLVMELCTGGELYHRLASRKKYSERDAANVTQQMLSAINYCHKHRICHRDLKLENWVYADSSEDAPVKLIDFGFSRIFNPGIPMTAMHGTVYYVSPEVMDGCYQEKCDIWSIGVIVYMLLSGSPPFSGNYDHEILVKIKRGVINFNSPRWDGISDNAKSFIRYLLQKNPDLRPSAEEALAHPWLQNQDTTEKYEIDVSVLKSMRDFALCNILKRAALNVVALGMTSQEVEDLETAFRKLDREKKGTISLHDLANVLIDHLHIGSNEALRIFNTINQTGSREVHYSEFIASTLQAKFVKDESLIEHAFKRFDVNNNKKITLEDLRSVLGDSYNGTRVEDIIALCDIDKDGYIDYAEFKNALTVDDIALSKDSNAGETQATTQDTQTKRESALTTLRSIRKATCLDITTDRITQPDLFSKTSSSKCLNSKSHSHEITIRGAPLLKSI